MPYGTIGRFNDMTILNRYKDSRSEERFSINNVISDAELRANTVSVEDAVKSYSTHFKTGKTVDEAYVHAMSGGDILMPDIHDDDDPFMIAVKTVIRSRGNVIISRYRDKFTEKHAIDNLRTTVLGATQNMSIDRFITWCDILSVNWEISLTDNGTDKNAPLTTDIIINNKNYDNIEIPYPENLGRGYFTPQYESGEDPLKRALKCAINAKHIKLKDYADALPTAHMLSNMRSSIIRSAQHNMSVPYFINWCEILGISFKIDLYDTETGKSFSVGRI